MIARAQWLIEPGRFRPVDLPAPVARCRLFVRALRREALRTLRMVPGGEAGSTFPRATLAEAAANLSPAPAALRRLGDGGILRPPCFATPTRSPCATSQPGPSSGSLSARLLAENSARVATRRCCLRGSPARGGALFRLFAHATGAPDVKKPTTSRSSELLMGAPLTSADSRAKAPGAARDVGRGAPDGVTSRCGARRRQFASSRENVPWATASAKKCCGLRRELPRRESTRVAYDSDWGNAPKKATAC